MKPKWIVAKHTVPSVQLQSNSAEMIPLLLVMPGYKHPVIGFYFGSLLEQFRLQGSNSEVHPTHWMKMPELPRS